MISRDMVHDFIDVDMAYADAAERIAAALHVPGSRRITLALSGGRSPIKLFELLRSDSQGVFRDIPWERVVVCWVDERFVPPDHPESNFGLARKWLLSSLPIPEEQILPMPTDRSSPKEAAKDYEQTLRQLFAAESEPADFFPRFDLVLLGMGPDGHVASLFPNKPALGERTRWVTHEPEPGMEPQIPRITLTLPVLNHAHSTVALVTGSKKQQAFEQALNDPDSRLPAALLSPQGEMAWVTCFSD
ncbi:6-phosphogluconolactonase [Desulfonatronum thioautotrophicum]|uniref:6-phosphogluconolactonase n=1 Tax=Desulfonatronum thioautotrophicum TaxID=617001 RepID=UPI00069C5D69|nr:6-phosphogluconolactonase [Desulfonatronum thioautotrophicum]